MSNTWTVQLPFEEVEALRSSKKESELEIVRLKKQLTEAQMAVGGTGEFALGLAASFRQSLKIVQWAQGNYDPETVRGWPYEALRAVALALKAMPGVTLLELEWADDALHYAGMAEVVERARKSGRQKELSQIPRSMIASSPQAYAQAADALLQQPPKEDDEEAEQPQAEQPVAPAPAPSP